ncbi:spore coat protein GerQ [Virgibacillus sp. YIM 98842]|jgi:spore germination protein Q|uniref:spore coat protein GerQ n=1 Tax=Virgibacillus sp. YIM 98842 TaxID=2663533 RepID=UPI0013DB6566|nr:spore coat protein GerQ [Virgibacillus sp. YIM 98842]
MSENDDRQNQQQSANPYQAYPYYYYPAASPAYYPMYHYRQDPQSQQFTQQQQAQQIPQFQQQDHGMLPLQQSFIENILRLNRGKLATVYMTFENNNQWNAKVFRGVIEAAGRDHLILSDPDTDRRYLLLMVYLDYVTFDEEINYTYPFGAGNQQLSSYDPR